MRTAILLTAVGILATRPAQAIPYETFIDINDEGDLLDLLSAGTITEDTYNELLELFTRGVDITQADRNELYALPNLTYDDVDAIIAYRDLNRGRIADPAELVAAGALSEAKLFAIASFLITRRPGEDPLAMTGWVRAWTRTSYKDYNPSAPYDPLVPPLAIRARVTAMRYVVAGFAFTNTRLQVGAPVYDPNRGALIAAPESNQLHLPKAFVKYEDDTYSAIAGTFRAGFGQRLVFDNSQSYTPNGLYLDDQLYYSADLASLCGQSAGELLVSPCSDGEYVTPDFRWRDGLLGIAAGVKRLELSTGWLQIYGFGSISRKGIYQYELLDAGKCEAAGGDRYDDDNNACKAPTVYVEPDGELLTPTSQHKFATLPGVFLEKVAGGNFAYYADRRNSVGFTAYGAQETDLVDGIELERQEWSRFPGGRYGAIGANFAFGRNWLDIFGEAALSFDTIPRPIDPSASAAKGGGGPAGVLRATATRKGEELEVVARYYATDFANPYARPISQPDEFEGQRARDEAGSRVRYIRTSKELTVRALVDVWTNPSDPRRALKLDTYVRANVRTSPVLWLGIWERYQDKDLERGGHNQCFEISNERDEDGEPIPCGGRQLTTQLRAQYVPNKQFTLHAQLGHYLLDDNTRMELMNKFRQDVSAWLMAYYRPTPTMRLRARVRYYDEAIHDNMYLETSVAGLIEMSTRVRERDNLRVRLDSRYVLDNRMSTANRAPNPELSLWLFYEAKL